MKILFLSVWFPYPPDNGARIRTYNLIRALAQRHKVYLISLVQDDLGESDTASCDDLCEVVSLHKAEWFQPSTFKSVLGFFSSRPRSAVATYDPTVQLAAREAIKRLSPDVIVVSTVGVVEYLPKDTGIPCVFEEHNCDFAVLRRAAERLDGRLRRFRYSLGWRKFARWEARMCRKFDAVTMVSEDDRASLLQFAPDLRNVVVVPNGVDIDHYTPSNRAPEMGALLYNGALTYGANLDAVRYYAGDIYPILTSMYPSAKLSVTGKTAGVDLQGIADCPGIELTGYVSDIRDVLRKSAVCVVPLRQGGGSRLKILEAMASGVPVVSTSIGAEGIDCVSGEHIILADTPSEFAEAVVRVMSDNEFADILSRRARELVEQKYSWTVIGSRFVDLVESLQCRKSSRNP